MKAKIVKYFMLLILWMIKFDGSKALSYSLLNSQEIKMSANVEGVIDIGLTIIDSV